VEFTEENAHFAILETEKIYTFCAALVPALRQEPEQNPQQSM
jgi:hypothetical protein